MKKVLLIVEDDMSLVKLYKKIFEKKNVEVKVAQTGQEGINLINLEKPDLVILDVILPGGINGFDVLEQIEKNPNTKDIPVIILTNLDSEENVAKSIGARKYLIKANTSEAEIEKLAMEYLG